MPEITNLTRPFALGYLRAHLMVSDVELDDARARIALHARQNGYQLGTIFVEQPDSQPAAYQTLIGAVWRQNATAVIVPDLHHFGPLGEPDKVRRHLEQRTGARVLVAGPKPQQPQQPRQPGEGFS